MTPVNRVISRLESVRKTAPGRWMAKCPAHEDRSPSLSIREGNDGQVLLYDFAGCGAGDVVAALGLEFRDLFPDLPPTQPTDSRRYRRPAPPIPAADALRILDVETMTVEIIADRLAKGEPLSDHRDALTTAASRIAGIRAAWRMQP